MFFRSPVVTVVALLVLSACGDDPFKQRKIACDQYVKHGHLTANEGQACYTEKSLFEMGALGEVADDMQRWYPRILRGAKKLNAHAKTYDKSEHRPLPLGTYLYWLDGEADKSKDWRYMVQLQNVNISPPSRDSLLEGRYLKWTLHGEREGEKGSHFYSIMGVGVYALQELDFSCSVFIARKSVGKGCQAKVYLDAVDGVPFTEITVMAIELTPPSKEEAFRTLMEDQMYFWELTEKEEAQ